MTDPHAGDAVLDLMRDIERYAPHLLPAIAALTARAEAAEQDCYDLRGQRDDYERNCDDRITRVEHERDDARAALRYLVESCHPTLGNNPLQMICSTLFVNRAKAKLKEWE